MTFSASKFNQLRIPLHSSLIQWRFIDICQTFNWFLRNISESWGDGATGRARNVKQSSTEATGQIEKRQKCTAQGSLINFLRIEFNFFTKKTSFNQLISFRRAAGQLWSHFYFSFKGFFFDFWRFRKTKKNSQSFEKKLLEKFNLNLKFLTAE